MNSEKYEKESEEVYYAKAKIINISKEEIDFLKNNADQNKRSRCRLCTHEAVNDKLHEMFIVHKKGNYIRPHKHLKKVESAHIVEGQAYLIIFDDQGGIIKIIRVGDNKSGHKFYYKITEPYYHTQLITSDYFIFHETTTGPFNRKDTVFASWSPNENDNEGIKKFLTELEKSIKQKES